MQERHENELVDPRSQDEFDAAEFRAAFEIAFPRLNPRQRIPTWQEKEDQIILKVLNLKNKSYLLNL